MEGKFMLRSVNPSNLKLINTYQPMQLSDINKIIDSTQKAFEGWRETKFAQRAELMLNAAEVLKRKKEKYAELMTLEMGKPIAQSRAEIEKCALVCEYYSEN